MAQEGLISLSEESGSFTGKPTQKGIEAVHSLHVPPSPVVASPEPRRSVFSVDLSSFGSSSKEATAGPMSDTIERPQTVFVGHGRSKEWLELKDYLSSELHLPCEEFNTEPAAGHTTQEHLKGMLNRATFAFLVMTADSRHADGKLYARENVIHEAGLLQWKHSIPEGSYLCRVPRRSASTE